jgi:hypothetical protein
LRPPNQASGLCRASSHIHPRAVHFCPCTNVQKVPRQLTHDWATFSVEARCKKVHERLCRKKGKLTGV